MIPSKKTLELLETCKNKEVIIYGYKSTQIEQDFKNLINNNPVEVGYRTSCGITDKTHKVFKEWLKIIKQLKKDGFIISEEKLNHANRTPTASGGFWNSIIYKIY